MNLQQLPAWKVLLSLAAWLAALALLPWWLGMSLLLALVVLLSGMRLSRRQGATISLRNGLRWGLPAVLFALQRALGGDALAWGIALLGVLAGYTLLAGLEQWLDRDVPRASAAMELSESQRQPTSAASDWPAKVMSSAIGPPAEIITLQAPLWQTATEGIADPWGRPLRYQDASYWFAGDRRIADVDACACFSPDGRWFAARMPRAAGVLLWDRRQDREHHLRGWHLAGWYCEQPWLQLNADAAPRPLQHVLGDDHAR